MEFLSGSRVLGVGNFFLSLYTYISFVNMYLLFKRRIDDYTLKIYLLCNNIYVSFIYHIDLFFKSLYISRIFSFSFPIFQNNRKNAKEMVQILFILCISLRISIQEGDLRQNKNPAHRNFNFKRMLSEKRTL